MDPLELAGIGGGVGLLGGILGQGQADKQRNVEAQKALTSPWLGLKPEAVKNPNLLSSTLGGGLAGFDVGQKGALWDKLGQASPNALAAGGGALGVDVNSPFQSQFLPRTAF